TIAAVVIALVPLLGALFSLARAEPIQRIIVSALIADTAWAWLTERGTRLLKIPFEFAPETPLPALTLKIMAILVLVAGRAWFGKERLKSRRGADVFQDATSRSRSS